MKRNEKPFISVVIPTWNRYKEIVIAVKSIEHNNYSDVEILVCDNHSEEKTFNKLKSFCSENNVKLFRNNTNIGMTANWNQAIKLSRGRWVSLLCSDDEFLSSGFNKAYNYLKTIEKPCLVIQNPNLKNIKILNPGYRAAREINLPIASGNFIHRECFEKCGYFNEKIEHSPDGEYWVRISTKFMVTMYPENFAKFNEHQKNNMFESWLNDNFIEQSLIILELNNKHKKLKKNIDKEKIRWNYYIFFLKNSIGYSNRKKITKKYLKNVLLYKNKSLKMYKGILFLLALYLYRKSGIKKLVYDK